jgi:hypothetical protein
MGDVGVSATGSVSTCLPRREHASYKAAHASANVANLPIELRIIVITGNSLIPRFGRALLAGTHVFSVVAGAPHRAKAR